MDFLEILALIPTAAYLLLAAGIVLAIVELCIPGFGVCGIGAVICFIISLIVGARSFAAGVMLAVLILVAIAILLILFSILASHGKCIKPLVLREKLGEQEGFSSSRDFSFLAGREGFAASVLRPAGRAQIDGKLYDVVTDGEFVENGLPIKVIEVNGSRIVVKACRIPHAENLCTPV